MGAKDVLNRFLGHVTAKRVNAASFMASLPGAPDMVSAGVEWDIDADTSELLEKEFRRLQVWGALEQAVKLARLYGRSIILMGTAAPDPMSRSTRAKPSSACGALTATKQSRPRRDGP